jgi:hypothetical protein
MIGENAMSHRRTDRGYALIKRETDGTSTVAVGTGVQDGQLVGIFAQHVHVSSVAIGPEVRFSTDGAVSVSTVPVDVFRPDGAPLQIRLRPTSNS